MVDREEILKIATLSKLFVSEEELPKLTTDMEQMIAFADTINNAKFSETLRILMTVISLLKSVHKFLGGEVIEFKRKHKKIS